MTDFKAIIDRHVAELTRGILAAIAQHSLDDLEELSVSVSASAPAPAPAARRRASLADVLELLSDHQGGLRREQIRESLDYDRADLTRVLADGLESQALVKTGERRGTLYFARWPSGSSREHAPEPETEPAPSETESSILEHLNEAGPKGSNLKAWIISTQGELEPAEHAHFEREGLAAFQALERRGTITSRNGGPARGTVYALAPAS